MYVFDIGFNFYPMFCIFASWAFLYNGYIEFLMAICRNNLKMQVVYKIQNPEDRKYSKSRDKA